MQHTTTLLRRGMAVLSLSIVLVSCEVNANQVERSGNVLEEIREVGEFSQIKAESFLDVYITQGDVFGVTVKADEELIGDITTEVNGEELVIGFSKNSWSIRNQVAKVYVSVPELSRVRSAGSSDVYFETDFTGNDFILSASGSSDIHAKDMAMRVDDLKISTSGSSDIVIKDLEAAAIDASTSGSSDIEIGGEAQMLEVDASGSSDFDGKRLTVEDCVADAGGASDINITVTGTIEADASGSSDINYWGNPQTNNIHESGAADVNRKN